MTGAFRLTPAAQADLDSIQDYLLARSTQASQIVADALGAAFFQLAEFPNMGHERPDLTERPVRFWGVLSYLVVYDHKPRLIAIIRVVHAARDIRTLRL